LESSEKQELENIQGVTGVEIDRQGDRYYVTVTLQDLEFSVFDKVIEQELALFDKYPNKSFNFDIMPEYVKASSLLNAA